jgi:hypothetical protein
LDILIPSGLFLNLVLLGQVGTFGKLTSDTGIPGIRAVFVGQILI